MKPLTAQDFHIRLPQEDIFHALHIASYYVSVRFSPVICKFLLLVGICLLECRFLAFLLSPYIKKSLVSSTIFSPSLLLHEVNPILEHPGVKFLYFCSLTDVGSSLTTSSLLSVDNDLVAFYSDLCITHDIGFPCFLFTQEIAYYHPAPSVFNCMGKCEYTTFILYSYLSNADHIFQMDSYVPECELLSS